MNYRIEKIGLLRKNKPIYSKNEKIEVGSSVKLVFKLLRDEQGVNAERLWVDVTEVGENNKSYKGKIDNDPVYIDETCGSEIKFGKENVFDIDNS